MPSLPPDHLPDDEPEDDALDGEHGVQDDPPLPRGPFTRENPLTFIVPEPLLLRLERVDRPGAAPGDQPVALRAPAQSRCFSP